jgi:hypothetical protein
MFAGVNLATYDHCHITATDGSKEIDDGMVIAHGDGVILHEYQFDRPVRQDRLTAVTEKIGRGKVTFTGTSRRLLTEVGVPPEDAVITYEVTRWKGCRTCK